MGGLEENVDDHADSDAERGWREKAYLFVYGTLMRGQRSHRELARGRDVRFAGAAKIQGQLYKFRNVNYPGAVPAAQGGGFVHGQLYVLLHPARILPSLDDFEGCGEGLFRRAFVDVWTRKRRVKAWTYFYARPLVQADLVPNGTYESSWILT
jgi:gamma-glutamylcyclotransferase (GGCT)/AIG2-like uncharacterized protein YtfP